MSLPTRRIGGTSVPIPGWGLMGFSAFYSTDKSDEDFIPNFKVAYEAGCTMWDTADIYSRSGLGQNERLVAKAMKALKIPRKDIFLCTKFGFGLDMKVHGDPAYIKQAIERSLKDLEMDYVDLYYQHRVDPNTPIEETVKAMQELKDAGRIRHIGLSECSAETLRRAAKVAKIDAVQTEYSLWETSIETNGVLDACKELGITLVAYSPLGRGMLSGKFRKHSDLPADDWRRTNPRFSEENFSKNIQLVDQLASFAKAKGCTAGQLALAWVHAQWDGIIAIPGTTRIEALEENIGSVKVELTKEELKEIRAILDQFPVAGTRYDAQSLKGLNI
ncbi:Aldo/keto reductase [Calocera cornea HHB12733]|uniref:Aldo/keto reductase n=1 Tax=Calocera cornea HHB12733 TaxID=1353952 RepID=A0A165CUD9_9BASI|nr:Aldo/keto reductase [Calocera cornea HHB12733]